MKFKIPQPKRGRKRRSLKVSPERPSHKPSLRVEFEINREKKHALASLGLSPVIPPDPGTLAYVRSKVDWIMAEAEKRFGSEFAEVVDIKKVKMALEMMLDSGEPDMMDKALKNVPGILVAVARWCKADKGKDTAKPPDAELEAV